MKTEEKSDGEGGGGGDGKRRRLGSESERRALLTHHYHEYATTTAGSIVSTLRDGLGAFMGLFIQYGITENDSYILFLHISQFPFLISSLLNDPPAQE